MSSIIVTLTDWQRDPDAYDPDARVRRFKVGDRIFTAHSRRGAHADQWPFTVRDARTYDYVTTVNNWRRLAEAMAELLRSDDPGPEDDDPGFCSYSLMQAEQALTGYDPNYGAFNAYDD